ncbi:MAG: hypothetical protein GDA56_27210 [Hormoscilla sp. GM7CHS1pb]|nr:hypothetical protein [Hormoscilla sp. GM7CHS1pb]
MASTTGLQGTELQAKTRVLLTLWQMGRAQEKVKKSELTRQSKRSREKAGDYKDIFNDLQSDEAIAIVTEKRVAKVSLTDKGLQTLGEGLKNPEFCFEPTQVGSRLANAVLDWYRQSDANVPTAPVTEKVEAKEGAIASYEDFKSKILALFEKLDKGYNYSGLVPIWHLRREFREGVGREQFNEWMMEMQAQKLFYLQSGEARGATDDQKQDSITSEVRGLLFYASQPS